MPIVKAIKQHKILLDTHVWLWLMMGSDKLSSTFKQAIKHSQANHGILISIISVWEVGMLAEKNRIQLEMDALDWILQVLDYPGIRLVPISPKTAIQSSRLPGTIQGDPSDRILIATAYEENAVLVTRDEKILDYGLGKFISVFDPT